MLPRSDTSPTFTAPPVTGPFASAEAAWFWTCVTFQARETGMVKPALVNGLPCRVEDVLKCLDTLYRQRRVELSHVRVLHDWDWREQVPDPAIPR